MTPPLAVVLPLTTALAMVAAWWAVPPPLPSTSLATSRSTGAACPGGSTTVADRDDGLARYRALLVLLGGAAPVVLLGGPVGVAGGLVVGAGVWRVLAGREPAAVRRRRSEVARALPLAVDLLAVTMAAGASPGKAAARVAVAVEPPMREELLAIERGLALGKDPVRVWREVARDPVLAALGRSMVRATESGASVAEAMHRLAEDLRRSSRSSAETRARAVGVKAAAPLGLCLLPAFVLVAVVPLVGSMVTTFLTP